MIDLHYAPTPNGWKISIMLEECGLPYRVIPVDLGRGEQHQPEFLKLSPNGRMPAIVDHAPGDGGATGVDLRERRDPDLSRGEVGPVHAGEMRGRLEVLQWLMWQMGGLGPMLGPERPFPALRAGEDSLRDRSLQPRGEAAVRRARHASSSGSRAHRRRLFDRGHGVLSLDHDPQGAGPVARRISQRQALVRSCCARGRACRPGSRSARRSASRWTSRPARSCSASMGRPTPKPRRSNSSEFSASFRGARSEAACEPGISTVRWIEIPGSRACARAPE